MYFERPLSELVSITKGKQHSLAGDRFGLHRYIQIDDLRNNDDIKYTNDTKGTFVEERDVVIAWDGANAGTIGYGLNGLIGSTLARLHIHTEGVLPEYLGRFLQSKVSEIRDNCTGATIPHVSKNYLESISVPLPSLATQKHIARVLEQADQLRKQAQQMESELNQLAQSLFLEMFGNPVTNPKRWATVPYADLCHRITVGIVVRPTDYYVDYGVPALRSLNVRENRIIKENFVYFSEANNVGPLRKTRVYKGDVVLVRSGQPGTAAVVPEELDGVNAIDILISTPIPEKVASNYLAFFFNSSGGKKIVGASERGQIQKHLNVGSLENAPIPVPPLSLQEEFIRRLNAIADVRRNAEENSESINITFDSLMQRSFNGELAAPERKAA